MHDQRLGDLRVTRTALEKTRAGRKPRHRIVL
jgi:hypothetical protein